MAEAFVSRKMGQFTYFSLQIGEPMWRGKKVLDFGGNIGNIFRDPNSTIEPGHYWCMDVVEESIERGRASYPTRTGCFTIAIVSISIRTEFHNLALPDLGSHLTTSLPIRSFRIRPGPTCSSWSTNSKAC